MTEDLVSPPAPPDSRTHSSPPRRLQVAIDGPAGAGKSTVARRVAEALGYTYVDTGAMYRAVAWAVLERGVDPDNPAAVAAVAEELDIRLEAPASGDAGDSTQAHNLGAPRVFADGVEITDLIRTPSISSLTSPLSAIPRVRRRLVALQKERGSAGGVVMEGRDIGTVVLPDAEVKVFLTASLEERAKRRQAELADRGSVMPLETVEADIAARDARDGSRDVAPMVPAPDAVLLDTDRLRVEEVVDAILSLHQEARLRHGSPVV